MKFRTLFFLFFLGLVLNACQKTNVEELQKMVDSGEFSVARERINKLLKKGNLPQDQKRILEFELERMQRIRKDFTATKDDVLKFIKQYIPDVTDKDLQKWEDEKKLEFMWIDGKKYYFKYAARNLFRLDENCKEIWQKKNPPSSRKFDLDGHLKALMAECRRTGLPYALPVRLRIKHTITVKGGIVPKGKTVRCWIPFPREIPHRQLNIKVIDTWPKKFKLAPNSSLQRTIYFEQESAGNAETRFWVEYEYTAHGVYVDIDPENVRPVKTDSSLAPFLKEEPPHIVFSDTLRKLSRKIVGNETNPYRIAQKIFAWIDTNITWASAREYSTIRNLSLYPILNGHGDCGIQTMLFITLLRMNGIPARWQSGWEFQPPDDSMHDWSMVYFEPYGWVPADVTYGMRKSEDEKLKYFYLNGMDRYRLIFNDGYSQPFVPPKTHFRSETVDSQRGEVEWDGGNLYFDQWDWDLQWKIVSE